MKCLSILSLLGIFILSTPSFGQTLTDAQVVAAIQTVRPEVLFQ